MNLVKSKFRKIKINENSDSINGLDDQVRNLNYYEIIQFHSNFRYNSEILKMILEHTTCSNSLEENSLLTCKNGIIWRSIFEDFLKIYKNVEKCSNIKNYIGSLIKTYGLLEILNSEVISHFNFTFFSPIMNSYFYYKTFSEKIKNLLEGTNLKPLATIKKKVFNLKKRNSFNNKQKNKNISVDKKTQQFEFIDNLFNYNAEERHMCHLICNFLSDLSNYHRSCSSVITSQIKEIGFFEENITKTELYNVSYDELYIIFGNPISRVLSTITEFIFKNKMYLVEGIFRLTGSTQIIEQIKDSFNENNLDMSRFISDPFAIATSLKMYLNQVHDKFFVNTPTTNWIVLSQVEDDDTRFKLIKEQVNSLDPVLKINLLYIVEFLSFISQFSKINMMTSYNLSVVFSPNLILCESQQEILILNQAVTSILNTLISNFKDFYPEQFKNSIFFNEREELISKIESPNDSVANFSSSESTYIETLNMENISASSPIVFTNEIQSFELKESSLVASLPKIINVENNAEEHIQDKPLTASLGITSNEEQNFELNIKDESHLKRPKNTNLINVRHKIVGRVSVRDLVQNFEVKTPLHKNIGYRNLRCRAKSVLKESKYSDFE